MWYHNEVIQLPTFARCERCSSCIQGSLDSLRRWALSQLVCIGKSKPSLIRGKCFQILQKPCLTHNLPIFCLAPLAPLDAHCDWPEPEAQFNLRFALPVDPVGPKDRPLYKMTVKEDSGLQQSYGHCECIHGGSGTDNWREQHNIRPPHILIQPQSQVSVVQIGQHTASGRLADSKPNSKTRQTT